MEFRLTPSSGMGKVRVGIMADFSQNFVGGSGQDFGMTRYADVVGAKVALRIEIEGIRDGDAAPNGKEGNHDAEK